MSASLDVTVDDADLFYIKNDANKPAERARILEGRKECVHVLEVKRWWVVY